MIIIVEGIDRVGKTTLCNKLNIEFNIPVHKYKGIIPHDKMNNEEETDKTLSLFQLLKEIDGSIIFDRTYFTDYVYGCIERKYNSNKASKNLFIIDDFVSKMDDVFLILVEPVDINKSSNEHGKKLDVHNKIFDELFKESGIKNKWKCTYNTLNEAIMFIKSKGVK